MQFTLVKKIKQSISNSWSAIFQTWLDFELKVVYWKWNNFYFLTGFTLYTLLPSNILSVFGTRSGLLRIVDSNLKQWNCGYEFPSIEPLVKLPSFVEFKAFSYKYLLALNGICRHWYCQSIKYSNNNDNYADIHQIILLKLFILLPSNTVII